MILTFGDRTYLMFCFLAVWWSFRQAKLTVDGEARARILAIEFVCFFSFFLSFLFLFIFTFSILFKKTYRFFNDLASSRSKAHTHKNKGGANRRGKAERRQRAVRRFTRFVDYELMFDSRGVHLVSKMVSFVHRISNP